MMASLSTGQPFKKSIEWPVGEAGRRIWPVSDTRVQHLLLPVPLFILLCWPWRKCRSTAAAAKSSPAAVVSNEVKKRSGPQQRRAQ